MPIVCEMMNILNFKPEAMYTESAFRREELEGSGGEKQPEEGVESAEFLGNICEKDVIFSRTAHQNIVSTQRRGRCPKPETWSRCRRAPVRVISRLCVNFGFSREDRIECTVHSRVSSGNLRKGPFAAVSKVKLD